MIVVTSVVRRSAGANSSRKLGRLSVPAAFFFPERRPDLYQASPANVKWLGIPVLKIVSPLSFLVMAFLTWETLHYLPLAVFVPEHRWYVWAFMGATVAFGLFVYYAAKIIRKFQGIDVDLVYRELPPE